MYRSRTLGRTALMSITCLAALAGAVPAGAASWAGIHTLETDGRVDGSRSMVVQGANAWVTYVDTRGVEIRRSSNGGATWGSEHLLETAGSDHFSSAELAVSGSHLIALYLRGRSAPADERWLVRRSDDGGRTWHAHSTVVQADPTGPAPSVSVGLTGSHAVIGWTDSETGAIRVRRSADAGATWKPAHTIGSTNIKVYWYEASVLVTASGGHVYVAWEPDRNGSSMATGIVMRRSDDGGATFHARTWLTQDALRYWGSAAIAASGDRLIAVYERAGGQLAVARSSDAGTTMHTHDVGDSQSDNDPAVALRGVSARLAVTTADGRVTLRSSSDAGAHWTSAASVTTGADNDASSVAVGLGTTGTEVAWEDGFQPPSSGSVLSRHRS